MPRVVSARRGSGAPERIGSYAVITELATGATSRVLLGQRDDEPEVRVLKQLRLELAGDSVARRRFQREAVLAARLDHPNIAKICWSGIEDGQLCIAMEFVPGQTLAAVSSVLEERRTPMPRVLAIAIALEILEGLAHAHELADDAGQPLLIVHRDLSPDNVMVSYAGRVKIIDFGTARARFDDFRTSPGVRIGTLVYMSPEQSMSKPVDQRSDLYTVSVVLWELLAGHRMLKATSSIDVLEEIAYQTPARLNELDPSISDDLAEVVARGLAKDPEHRWQSARELGEALRSARPRGVVAAEQLGSFMRDLFPVAEADAAQAIVLGRERHLQDQEETIPDEGSTLGERTLYLDTMSSDVGPTLAADATRLSSRRLPPEPAASPRRAPLLVVLLVVAALMVGFTLGLLTERSGWWRPPPPGGPGLHRANPP